MTHLKEGEQAPDFSYTDKNGNTIQLADFKGKKLVLYFYPKDNTPGCNAEACNLRDHYQQFTEQGYSIVGVSPDPEEQHHKFIEKFDLPFPLIADTNKTLLKAYGAWGTKKMYGKEYEGVLRTTFVIDADGKIEKIFTKVKTKEHSQQIFKALEL